MNDIIKILKKHLKKKRYNILSVNMGKVKDLLMEIENVIGEIDDEVLKQMLGRYIEEKGLKNAEEFEPLDFDLWQKHKRVIDIRTPEQNNNEQNKVVSLQEISEMTQEEAEELGVGEIKKMWHEDLEKEYLERQRKENEKQMKELYELTERYVIETGGFDREDKIDVRKMKEWCEEKSIPLPKALKEHYNIQ